MKTKQVGTFGRRRQAAFFLIVYVSPFVAMYIWATYGLIIGKFPFQTLLIGVLTIWLTYGAVLATYRKFQPYLQMWRISRAAKREVLNVRKTVHESPS